MKKTFKVLALDLDGTLLNEQCHISPENEQAIRQATAHGIHVCVATGRGYHSAIDYVRQLGLTTPLVVTNGSEVWRTPDELHTRIVLEPTTIRALRALAEQLGVWYWAYSAAGLYNKEQWIEAEEQTAWLKFGFFTEDAAKRDVIRQRVPALGTFEVTHSHPHNVELNPVGISKATGLAIVCTLLDVRMEDIIAVGDSNNDVSMLRAVGLGVAMGNAEEAVKAIAGAVTTTNEAHGVASVIARYILA